MKLILMTDFVINESENKEVSKNFSGFSDIVNNKKLSYDNILNYANFLKQPLELWMFIPCDKVGSVLEKVDCDLDVRNNELLKYQQAKEKCFFKNFTFDFESRYTYYLRTDKGFSFSIHKKIESNIEYCIKYDLELTQTALKQIGL